VPSKLNEADKFDLQQYITRCYGSLTTFNILFKNNEDQFRSGAVDTPHACGADIRHPTSISVPL